MGINLLQSSIRQLMMLVIKRIIYLIAKLISFKGLAFVVGCFFLKCGIISGLVWCSLVFGIIANRTGKEILTKIKSETPEKGEDN